MYGIMKCEEVTFNHGDPDDCLELGVSTVLLQYNLGKSHKQCQLPSPPDVCNQTIAYSRLVLPEQQLSKSMTRVGARGCML